MDWEGALQGAKAAGAFSLALWKRINGVETHEAKTETEPDTDEPDSGYLPRTAKQLAQRREMALRDAGVFHKKSLLP